MLHSLITIVKQFASSKYLPWAFALTAALMMLPALKTPLVMDDLLQRIPQLDPSQIPQELHKTGMVPENTGQLSTVMLELFGFPRDKTRRHMARNYGIMPWWFSDNAQAALWRPFTAFTHWLDYRLFPDSPPLMHAHNIAWFAAVVFLAAIIYRRIIGPSAIAALAALMFVLDKNTYFPVMFVANRGFIVSLCFGLLCFYMHHKWRSTNSITAAIFSVIFFTLSLFSNEAGVSTFAFILAYTLILDKAPWPKRLLTLVPPIMITIIWRIIYNSLGFGVSGIGVAYLDPGHELLKFLSHFPGYFLAVIAGQLSAVPPDVAIGLNPQYYPVLTIFYIIFTVITIILFTPVIRRNTIARFWFAVMIFAAIPIVAAPSGKNFGFVAIGAFGLIAVFADDLIKNKTSLSRSRLYKHTAYVFCIILLIAHIPSAAASKLITPKLMPATFGTIASPKGLNDLSLANDSNVVIVNGPCLLSACAIPFDAAYYHRPIPNSIRTLALAYSALEIERTDNNSIVITSKESNIFTANKSSPIHLAHAFATIDQLFSSSKMFEGKNTFTLDGMIVNILALDDKGLPKEISFTFDVPLDDESFRWVQFSWKTLSYKPFTLPKVGQTVVTQGPPVVDINGVLRFLFHDHETPRKLKAPEN